MRVMIPGLWEWEMDGIDMVKGSLGRFAFQGVGGAGGHAGNGVGLL